MRGSPDFSGCFPTGRHYPGIAHLLRIVVSGLCDEFTGEGSIHELPLVAIDTETTGRDPAVDRIVEIACIRWHGGAVVERKSWLVNPDRPIPQEAFEVHGISDEAVADKPKFAEVAEELLEALEGAIPVAYNAEYDRTVLHAELARLANRGTRQPPSTRKAVAWFDPLIWARELHKAEKGKSLIEVSQRLGIELPQAHRAEHDAEAALRVLVAFMNDVRVPRTYAAFVQEQRRLQRLFDEERRVWKNRLPTAAAAPTAPS